MGGRENHDVPGDPGQALEDADDEALTETDVDPTGNVLRNDAVETAEGAAAAEHREGPVASG
jgi:hypothetical protein